MPWKVTTAEKNNVTEVGTWTNESGETLKHTVAWRWGSWIVNDKPDLASYDEGEGMDPYDLGGIVELGSLEDAVSDEWEYPASWKKKDINKFHKLWDEEGEDAIETMGFDEEDTECWVRGPLEVVPEDDDSDSVR